MLTEIRRNPYYRGRRPHHLAGFDVEWNFDQTSKTLPDETSPSAEQIPSLAAKYGVNRSRFWVEPVNCIGWLLFNNTHGLFKNNIPMRKAVNWALDRKAYAAQAGPYAGSPWTHLLPPGSPGSIGTRRLQPYSPGPNIAKARKLAKGHFKDGKVTVAYRSTGTIYPAQAQIVRHGLIVKPEEVIEALLQRIARAADHALCMPTVNQASCIPLPISRCWSGLGVGDVRAGGMPLYLPRCWRRAAALSGDSER